MSITIEAQVRAVEQELTEDALADMSEDALKNIENRLRTAADHLAVELRRRRYPHAFDGSGRC